MSKPTYAVGWLICEGVRRVRISAKGRYAVTAMIDLALQAKSSPATLAEIAKRQDISVSYLEQLFSKLRRGGLIHSVRGPGGGYKLARNTYDIAIADIILAIEQDDRKAREDIHPVNDGRTDQTSFASKALWKALGNQTHIFLASISLDDAIHSRFGDLQFNHDTYANDETADVGFHAAE